MKCLLTTVNGFMLQELFCVFYHPFMHIVFQFAAIFDYQNSIKNAAESLFGGYHIFFVDLFKSSKTLILHHHCLTIMLVYGVYLPS